MKTRILVLALIAALILSAGCTHKHKVTFEPNPAETVTTITAEDELYKTVDGWDGRLEAMAEDTNAAFDLWESGESNLEAFLGELQRINNEMRLLKRESDLKTEFDMNGTDTERLRWNNLLLAYDNAKKDLNDFLVLAPELDSEEQIKEMYNNKVKANFHEDHDLIRSYIDEHLN